MSVSAFAQNLEDSFIAKEACGDDVAAFVENAPFRRISLKPPAICPQKIVKAEILHAPFERLQTWRSNLRKPGHHGSQRGSAHCRNVVQSRLLT